MILELAAKGMSGPQIAAAVGCSRRTVFNVRKAHGVSLPPIRHDWEVADETLKSMLAGGYSYMEISKATGIPGETLRARATALGVKRTYRHGTPTQWEAGCRCELCLPAMRAHGKAKYEKMKGTAVKKHGVSGFKRGCRCTACFEAKVRHFRTSQAQTLEKATSHRNLWTSAEDKILEDASLTVRDAATILGRSFSAVENRRHRIKSLRKASD